MRLKEREPLLQEKKNWYELFPLLDEILAFCSASLFLFVKLIRSTNPTIALANNIAKSVLGLLYPLPISISRTQWTARAL